MKYFLRGIVGAMCSVCCCGYSVCRTFQLYVRKGILDAQIVFYFLGFDGATLIAGFPSEVNGAVEAIKSKPMKAGFSNLADRKVAHSTILPFLKLLGLT